jgi:8-oxo-dGTP pyrophosphatase MutT (NUDIX family)
LPDLVRAAGVMFLASDGAVLLMRRTDTGEWSFPGGGIEGDETPAEAAAREAEEETGRAPEADDLREHTRRIKNGVDFTTFLAKVGERFDPELNDEHDAWRWAKPEELIAPPITGVPTASAIAAETAQAPEPATDTFFAKLDAALARLDAVAKITMEAAGYTEDGHGDERCKNCTMFRAPDACTLVEGDIHPEGWCRHFEMSQDARLDAALARLDG